jgi:hypothetical protein
MFDYQDFFSMEGVYRYRYAGLSQPQGLYAGVGTIFSSAQLPGMPPNIPDPSADPVNGRNWLYAPPPYKMRGIVLDITETYWLSGRGGWPKPIYSLTAPGGNNTTQSGNDLANVAPPASSYYAGPTTGGGSGGGIFSNSVANGEF